MRGRFTQSYTWGQVHALVSVFGRELVSMRRGRVPAWWKVSLKEVPWPEHVSRECKISPWPSRAGMGAGAPTIIELIAGA